MNLHFELQLYRSDHVLSKISNDIYAQNLYAALCNMRWQHKESGEIYFTSWRGSGHIIATLRQTGDYLDWYCSFADVEGHVSEGTVTNEVAEDLAAMGWLPLPWDDDK